MSKLLIIRKPSNTNDLRTLYKKPALICLYLFYITILKTHLNALQSILNIITNILYLL